MRDAYITAILGSRVEPTTPKGACVRRHKLLQSREFVLVCVCHVVQGLLRPRHSRAFASFAPALDAATALSTTTIAITTVIQCGYAQRQRFPHRDSFGVVIFGNTIFTALPRRPTVAGAFASHTFRPPVGAREMA